MVILPQTFLPPADGKRYVPNPELLDDMAARDRVVRSHEQAHFSAAGQYARGGIEYTYQMGPDGMLYAVGGHVNIDTSEPDDPDQCLEKMEIVAASACAPCTVGDHLSAEDESVLAKARAAIERAKAKKAEKAEKAREEEEELLSDPVARKYLPSPVSRPPSSR